MVITIQQLHDDSTSDDFLIELASLFRRAFHAARLTPAMMGTASLEDQHACTARRIRNGLKNPAVHRIWIVKRPSDSDSDEVEPSNAIEEGQILGYAHWTIPHQEAKYQTMWPDGVNQALIDQFFGAMEASAKLSAEIPHFREPCMSSHPSLLATSKLIELFYYKT